MKKLIAYPISAIYYLFFGLILVVFHVIQWICFNLFGYEAHKKSADGLLLFLVLNTYMLGTRYKIIGLDKLPSDTPLIIVSNHQSWYDITSLGWYLRRVHPKFVSKIELGKGIPSISYNLRNGGSVLIDRKNAKQSISAVQEMAKYIEEHKRSVVIFPEGTRSRTSKPLPFAVNGLKILCKYAPSAHVVPVTINNSWKMTKWGSFPLGIGNTLEFIIHNPIPVKDMPFQELFDKTERVIIEAIK